MSALIASATNSLPFTSVLGEGEVQLPTSSFDGKILGLYFSAHWCGPCRSFTPNLAEKYNEITAQGHPFEIVFISADENEEEALDYFKSMPWKMLAFSNREAEDALSKKYQIRGIPTLVLLDADRNVLAKEGRDLILETPFPEWTAKIHAAKLAAEAHERELADLKATFRPSTFFSKEDAEVVDKNGNVVPAADLQNKLIGLYFSAHWCPPCRQFTPKLAEKYQELTGEGKALEIIFVSSDRDEASAQEYFSSMPWKMLKFSARKQKQLLSDLFKVSGIPSLVIVNDEKGLVTLEGRTALMTVPFDEIVNFDEEQARKEAMMAEKMASFPAEITIDKHEHPLVKTEKVYGGQYGCDICGGGGKGWVYHCGECNFDAHPLCVHKIE